MFNHNNRRNIKEHIRGVVKLEVEKTICQVSGTCCSQIISQYKTCSPFPMSTFWTFASLDNIVSKQG